MAQTQQILERANAVLIGNYARQPVVMARGQGPYLWDTEGRKYIDLFAGFGGAILGHAHPALVRAATQQAQTLWHVGNTFHTEAQVCFAEKLRRHAFDGKAFFCHGGADANEAAVKLARLKGMSQGGRRWKTISLIRSFHGRTLAMIAATGNPAVREGFGPVVPGFTIVEANDFESLVRAADDETACVIMEPIQGEGGINLYPEGHIARIREFCSERDIVLIFDEVWTGCGRTGRWFGHQHFRTSRGEPVLPDIMTLGKAVGGGLPVGVMFARSDLASLMTPGKHGSTLGGNPICMAAANAVFETIESENLTENAANLGEHAMSRLRGDSRIADKVVSVRGKGLFIGVELREPPQKLVEKALERGLVINLTSQKVVRIAPPINITRAELDEGLDILLDVLATL